MRFYSHLIDIESIVVELDSLNLSDKEKHHLASLVDSSLHQTILDLCLSKLSEEDRKVFLEHLRDEKHDKIWELLNDRVDKIEDEIKKAAEDLKTDFKKDIKEAKEKK